MIEQILMLDVADPWFWGTHAGAELDVLVSVGGRRVGVEIKRTDQPRLIPSMRHALVDLRLDRLVVVHAGGRSFPLAASVEAVAAGAFLTTGLLPRRRQSVAAPVRGSRRRRGG